MKTLIKIFFTTIFVLILSHLLPGVSVTGWQAALLVALVLGLLNIFVKPVLVILTLPATIFTLGLFLLVINAIIIILCDSLVPGFDVRSFWSALLFSIVLSVCQSLVSGISERDNK
jgi:putative membrane protein